jgi:hypothetical protein
VFPIKKGVLNINKVDIPAINYSKVEIDLEYSASNYYRTSSFLGIKILLEATDNLAGFIASIRLYVIDPLTSKDPITF